MSRIAVSVCRPSRARTTGPAQTRGLDGYRRFVIVVCLFCELSIDCSGFKERTCPLFGLVNSRLAAAMCVMRARQHHRPIHYQSPALHIHRREFSSSVCRVIVSPGRIVYFTAARNNVHGHCLSFFCTCGGDGWIGGSRKPPPLRLRCSSSHTPRIRSSDTRRQRKFRQVERHGARPLVDCGVVFLARRCGWGASTRVGIRRPGRTSIFMSRLAAGTPWPPSPP